MSAANHGRYELKGASDVNGHKWTVVCRRSQFGDSIDYRVNDQPYSGTGLLNTKSEHTVALPRSVASRPLTVTLDRSTRQAFVTLPGDAVPRKMEWFLSKRQVMLEVDVEEHPTLRRFDKSGDLAKVYDWVTKGFANAGIDMIVTKHDHWIPAMGANEVWTPSSLNKRFLGCFNSRVRDPDIPKYHMLLLYKTTLDQHSGVMYDDKDDTPREGAACFFEQHERDQSPAISLVQNLAYTMVHETAHAMNLPHSFVGKGNSPAVSFMNYEERWAAAVGKKQAEYWKVFLPFWNFENHELKHLWHAEPRAIFPGEGTMQFVGDSAHRARQVDSKSATLRMRRFLSSFLVFRS